MKVDLHLVYLQAAVQIPGNLRTESTLSDAKIKGIKMYGDTSDHVFFIEAPDKQGKMHKSVVPWTNMKSGFLQQESSPLVVKAKATKDVHKESRQ